MSDVQLIHNSGPKSEGWKTTLVTGQMIVGDAIGGPGAAFPVGGEDSLVDVWGLLVGVEGFLVGVERLLVVLTVDIVVLSFVDDFADVLREGEPGAGVPGVEVTHPK